MSAGSSWVTFLGSRLARKSLLWWFALIVWATVLWSLSANPSLPSGPSFPLKDKLLHCTYFCGGAACLLLALFGKTTPAPGWRTLALRSLPFTAIIGALDEFHQTFTPGRSGNDPWDWLADVAGGGLAAWVVMKILLRLRQTDPTAV
jgi:VanZ family protein